MGKLALNEATLGVLHAVEEASNTLLECREAIDISFDIDDWSIGSLCRKLSSELPHATAISQLSRDRRRLESIIQLLKGLTSSACELLDLHERKMAPISTRLSRSLDSLPDEILAVMFYFATLDEQEGTRHAFWISHVSRRFRQVCLGNHHIWSTIRMSQGTTMDCIETCISRSGKDTDLSVILDYGPTFDAGLFLEAYPLIASRCRSLALSNSVTTGKHQREPVGDGLRQLMQGNKLELPRLHDLFLGQCQWPIDCDRRMPTWRASPEDAFLDVPSWKTPNLHHLRCIQYVPPRSFSFTSFTTISLSLMLTPTLVYDQAEALSKFLLVQRNLLTVELELDTVDGDFELKKKAVNPVLLPSVKIFRLKVMNIDLFPYDTSSMKPFWWVLQMPNLENVSLVVRTASDWEPQEYFSKDSSTYHVEIDFLLPEPDEHPNLLSLSVDISPSSGGAKHRWSTRSLVFTIPLQNLPSSLTVTTLAQVSFTLPKARVGDPHAYRGPSRLREVCLHSCKNLDYDGLQNMRRSLRDAKAWAMLDEVIIKDCESLSHEMALKAIGKARLRFDN